MSTKYCVVPFCKNSATHRFAKDPLTKAKWVQAVKRKNWQPTTWSRVCSTHFRGDDFLDLNNSWQQGLGRSRKRLRKTAVPSVFKWTGPPTPAVQRRAQRWQKRSQLELEPPSDEPNYFVYSEVKAVPDIVYYKDEAVPDIAGEYDVETDAALIEDTAVVKTVNQNVTTHDISIHGCLALAASQTEFVNSDTESYDETVDTTGENPDIGSVAVSETEVANFLHDTEMCEIIDDATEVSTGRGLCTHDDEGQLLEDDVELPPLKMQKQQYEETTNTSDEEKKRKRDNLTTNYDIFLLPYMCIERLQHDDYELNRYTGLDSFSKFQTVFWSLGENVHDLTYALTKSKSCPLSPINCFLLLCIKLRCNFPVEELARGFSISDFSVLNIFYTWVRFCSLQWGEINFWPSKPLVQYYFPTDFKKKYGSTRVVIDCTEIPIKKPAKPTAQRACFSTYKHRHTAKVLVGSTPSGLVSIVSPA